MPRYPHGLVISRPTSSPGTQDPDTGVYTPAGAATMVYEGRADVQDGGEQKAHNAAGMPEKQAEGTAFLADRRTLFDIRPGDDAEVTYPDGATADGVVVFYRVVDAAVLLRFH